MDVFSAIAEPNRRHLIDLLARRGRSAGELVKSLPKLTQPAVSRHLKVLRESGLVSVRVEGQKRIYSLEPQRLGEVDRWLERHRKFWNDRLDALEKQLAGKHRPARRKR